MNRRTTRFTLSLVCLALLSACAGKSGPPPSWDMDEPAAESYSEERPEGGGPLQAIAYNIERGFYWEDVAAYVEDRARAEGPPVLLLSELDRNHSRTGDIFVARELARRLRMDMVFVSEFVEYNDETPETQGDHGNAILSPYPLSDISVIRHRVLYSWTRLGWTRGEPRHGGRASIGATVEMPGGEKVRVYSVHFESNGETLGKWIQMKEVLDDAESRGLPFIIGGDFNELPFGLMFAMLPARGVENAFAGDRSPTGDCKNRGGEVRCSLKIDWIVYKGLRLEDSAVDYPAAQGGEPLSDHAPVRAAFSAK